MPHSMLTAILSLLGIAGATVIVSSPLLRKRLGHGRGRVRRMLLLLGLYALALSGFLVASSTETERGVSFFRIAADFLEILLLIELGTVAVFELTLRALRLRYPEILRDLSLGTAYVVAIGWLMRTVGVNLTSLIATSAVVTAVVGLSLQATLGSIVGGLVLQFDDSIKEGDFIELENKVQGVVKHIRWRHTVVETRDWDTLVIPNSVLLAQTIKILGKKEGASRQHRMWVLFNVDFRYPPGDVIRVVVSALQSTPLPNVASEPPPQCILYDLAREHRDSFAMYAVRYFLIDLAVDDPTSSLVRERIYAALKRAQIPLAVPAATVFLSQDDAARQENKRQREQSSRLAALSGVDLFSRLSPEELRSLAESAHPVPFMHGEIITRQGAIGHFLYVLTKGEVEVYITGPDGQERKVADLRAPAFFGEMALMTGEPREATVVARSDVTCLRIDKPDFHGILASRPEVVQEISAVLAQRRIELRAVREGLDAEARARQIVTERGQILFAIRDFFGLKD